MKTFIFTYRVARHVCNENIGMCRHFNVEAAWSALISGGVLDYDAYVYLRHVVVEETAEEYASRLIVGKETDKCIDYSIHREASHELCICGMHQEGSN